MKDRYFDFLCSIVRSDKKFSKLLKCLYDVEFLSLIPNDDNRGVDGEFIREIYFDEVGPQGSSSLPDGACRVLEMLIGVAKRLDFDLANSHFEKRVDQWFWILIKNLKLDVYDDIHFSNEEVMEKVSQLLERRYMPNGEGGLFPLKMAQNDQRNVEIWYQMSAWIIENYPI